MRIACLQFAPQVGDVDHNLNRADAVLSKANFQDLDLLVVPEMAFSGYNFRSLQHIAPFLEPSGSGITSLWARCKALKYNCMVSAGYPEIVDNKSSWPSEPEYYNSTITVNADGETIANYRKSHLYETDETWALESCSGFYGDTIPGLGQVAMGICTDLNPYQNRAPWSAWEFSHHILHVEANLVILSCAWLTREHPKSFSRSPREPDMDSLSYWLARLEPIIRAESVGEIIVVIANRCGMEEEAVYAGSSAVLGIHAGEVKVYGILGRGEKELLVVDTSEPCQAKLVSTPNVASGISVAYQSADCDSSPFHGSSIKSTDLRTAIPFRYPVEAFSPAPETPCLDNTDEVSKSNNSLRMASDLNKSIFAKHLESLKKKTLAPAESERRLHTDIPALKHSSKQKERIPITLDLDSKDARPNATLYEDFVPESPPVARIAPDYFSPNPSAPPSDIPRDILQSTTGKTGLITPSPESAIFHNVPFPRTGMEFQQSWEHGPESIPLDEKCFSPVSLTDHQMSKPYFGLGLDILHQEVSRGRTEFIAAPPSPATVAAIQRPESTKSRNASRNRFWQRDLDTSIHHEHQDQSMGLTYTPPQNHYDDRPELRLPRPSGIPQGYYNSNVRRSRDSTPSRQSTQSSHMYPSHQSTPCSEYTPEVLQPGTNKSIFTQIPESAKSAPIEQRGFPISRDSSCYRQASHHRSRRSVPTFPVDSVASAVAAIEGPSQLMSRMTSRNRHQSSERSRSSTGIFRAQDTIPKSEANLSRSQIISVSISPFEPTPTERSQVVSKKPGQNPPDQFGAYQSWATRTLFGPRCGHIIPRPGSAMW